MATRSITKATFENFRHDRRFFRELSLDGRKLFVFAANVEHQGGKDIGAPRIVEQYGTRFATAHEAGDAFDKMVELDKTRFEKHVQKDHPAEGTGEEVAAEAKNPALEAALLDGSDARVCPDWLQSQGDPRGELAALHQAGKTEQADAFLRAQGTRLLGELDVTLGGCLKDLAWTHGFLTGATLKTRYDGHEALHALTEQFLALPLTRFLTTLRFGLSSHESGSNDWGPSLAAILASPRAAQLKVLRFTEYTSEDCEISWTPFGDLSAVWQLPVLEELAIRSGQGGVLGTIASKTLTRFERISGGLAREEIDAIATAHWPNLRSLDVWFGRGEYGAQGTAGSLARILDGQTAPALTHFGAINCEFTPDLIGPLAVSKLLPRLKTLSLAMGTLMDTEALELIKHRAAFAHLERLDLSENLINEAGPELLQALPMAVLGDQRYGDTDDGEYRYAALGE